MKIQLGYEVKPLYELYQELYEIVQEARSNMFAGDLEISTKNLRMALRTARDYPPFLNTMFNMTVRFCKLNILSIKNV